MYISEVSSITIAWLAQAHATSENLLDCLSVLLASNPGIESLVATVYLVQGRSQMCMQIYTRLTYLSHYELPVCICRYIAFYPGSLPRCTALFRAEEPGYGAKTYRLVYHYSVGLAQSHATSDDYN